MCGSSRCHTGFHVEHSTKKQTTKSLNHSLRWRFLAVFDEASFNGRSLLIFAFLLHSRINRCRFQMIGRDPYNRLHHENQRTTRGEKKTRFQLKIDWQSIAALRNCHTHPRTTRTNRRRDPSRSLRTVAVVVELGTHTQENETCVAVATNTRLC